MKRWNLLCRRSPIVTRTPAVRRADLRLEALEPRWVLDAFNEFALATGSARPEAVASEADGDLWTLLPGVNKVARVTAAGDVTEVTIPTPNAEPTDIVLGPDGNLWFTESGANRIGRLNPNTNVIDEFPLPDGGTGAPHGITVGPDNNLWFTELAGGRIGRITTAGAITEFLDLGVESNPAYITAGGDGNLYFSQTGDNQLGVIDTNGTLLREIQLGVGAQPLGITRGPDNNIWFTAFGLSAVCRLTVADLMVQTFATPTANSEPYDIVNGGDGNLYFTGLASGQIGRVALDGTVTEITANLPNPPNENDAVTPDSGPRGIARRATDGAIAFAESAVDQVGALVLNQAGEVTAVPETPFRTGDPQPSGLTRGPDNNLWFVEGGIGVGKIGRISPDGRGVVEYYLPDANSEPRGIVDHPDGNLYFTLGARDAIGRITTAGVIQVFAPDNLQGAVPSGIEVGPDSNLWFTAPGLNAIGMFVPTTGVVALFTSGITENSTPTGITLGPDNKLWFTEFDANKIANITTAGLVTEFSTGLTANSTPLSIVTGPDGALWFTSPGTDRIGRITTAGAISEFLLSAGSGPTDIIPAPDGALFFTESGFDRISRITNNGLNLAPFINAYQSGVSDLADPTILDVGSDGNLYFSEMGNNAIAKFFLLNPTRTTISGTVNTAFQGAITTFTDGDPTSLPTDFAVTIDWNDQTGLDTSATVTKAPNGTFTVNAVHNYTFAGIFTPTITITDTLDDRATVTFSRATFTSSGPTPPPVTPPAPTPPPTGASTLLTIDLNRDGNPETVRVGRRGEITITVNGVALPAVFPFPRNSRSVLVAAGDVNGDGHVELVVFQRRPTRKFIRILNGSGQTILTLFNAVRANGKAVSVVLADFNGDGRTDIQVTQARVVKRFDGLTGGRIS